MTVESAQDRASFFDTDDFGTVATYDGGSVNGIFDVETAEGDSVAGLTFTCAASDVDGVVQGENIIIGGITRMITGVIPDVSGDVVTLVLRRA